ncbi:MAG: hypothetical protein ACLRNW_19015 [Neglectibacter sp.]
MVILLLINVLLLFVRTIMDTGPQLVFTPAAGGGGHQSIHPLRIITRKLAIGFVTRHGRQPVGQHLSKVSVFDIARKAVPFILAFLIALLLITFVPQISMFLLQ